MSGLLKNEGVQQMEVRTLGGETGRVQDVTVILIPKGGSRDRTLALIHLHSLVLSTHSKYFNTRLRERLGQRDSPSEPVEFYLEVQTDVQHYFNCFSNMYSPFGKSFESVGHGLELLKVASQIDFGGLMERISFFISSMYWSEEEEIKVREYAASPDFPRIHLKDLVGRLGLETTQEDREKQLYVLVNGVLESLSISSEKQLYVLFNGVVESSSIPSVLTLPAFLKAIRCAPPSEYSRKVVAILSQAAKEVFFDIGRDCDRWLKFVDSYSMAATFKKIRVIGWILEALLEGQVAEELVQGIVHLHQVPKYISLSAERFSALFSDSTREFAELVLVMYKEVVAGRLVLKPSERMALLANWHPVLKSSLKVGTFEAAAADLFLTLPLKQQAELIHLQKERVFDFISTSSLASVLHFH